MILNAAVNRSIPNTALPSNLTNDVFVSPAPSSNLERLTGPAHNLPNALLSTTTGWPTFLLTRTLIPKIEPGPNWPALNTYGPGHPAVPPAVNRSSVSLFAGVSSSVFG